MGDSSKVQGILLISASITYFFSFRQVYPSNWDLEVLLFIHTNTLEQSRQEFPTPFQGGDGVASAGLTAEL